MKNLTRRVDVILHQRSSHHISPQHCSNAGTPRAVPMSGAESGLSAMTGRGFTLVELVMVMVIIGILAVFVVSRMDFQSTFRQRGLHDKLKSAIQFARKAAVAQRRYVCVTANPGFVEFRFNPNDLETVNVATLPGSCTSLLSLPFSDIDCGGAASRVCAPSGMTISGANFWFDARGGSSSATTVTFSSTGQPDIKVENETGYVH